MSLDRDLERLGEALDWPATPDLTTSTMERLDGVSLGVSSRRKRVAMVVALALLIPAGAAAAGVDVLDWVGLKHVDELPQEARRATDAELGEKVTREEAARRAGFDPILPPRLGEPDEVRVRGRTITLVYAGGLRLAQFRGGLVDKFVTPSNRVTRTRDGVFIEGRHAYLYRDPDGDVQEGTTRIAGNTFLTERGGVLLRLEGDDRLTIAEAERLISRSG